MAQFIFFSWQSSRSPREGRNLIERALKIAIENLSEDAALEEAIRDGLDLDKDTKNVPGNPPIFDTILRKDRSRGHFRPRPDLCRKAGRRSASARTRMY